MTLVERRQAGSYKTTFSACVAGIFNQAVITNITAILFVSFMSLYGFELWQLGVMVGVNFAAQIVADVTLTVLIDRIDFRRAALLALSLSVVGIVVFALLPQLSVVKNGGSVYPVMLAATLIFAFSSGMLEVLVSPITDSIPDSKSKGGAMALMHSFYAWGQVLTIIVTSLFLVLAGAEYWYIVTLFWTIVPLVGIVLFLVCPMEKRETSCVGVREKTKTAFSAYMLMAMLAIFTAGGTEIIMNQYVSTLATLALGFDKVTADLVGMCLFAVMMGIGRTFYGFTGDKLDMHKVLTLGALASFALYLIAGLVNVPVIALTACVLCGLTSSLLWPGTLVVAGARYPDSGAWIFALLAICGDIGGSVLPTVAGFFADDAGLTTAFMLSSVVPLMCCLCNAFLWISDKRARLIGSSRR